MRPVLLLAAISLGCVELRVDPLTTGAVDSSTADGDAVSDASCEAGEACALLAPSCDGLPKTCAGESCCTSILLPRGSFGRSYDESKSATQGTVSVAGFQNNPSNAPAVMQPFWLDRYEVTVARFRKFVDAYDKWSLDNPIAGRGENQWVPGSGWQAIWNARKVRSAELLRTRITNCTQPSFTSMPGENDNKPINCVNWFDAQMFCIFDGGHLPTEAEWNYAAAGGDQHRAFPWSSPSSDTSFMASFAVVDRTTGSGLGLANVGSITDHDARWKHRDLAGNVWEWVFDAIVPGAVSTYSTSGTHPASLAGDHRLIRGGSWKFGPAEARTAYRFTISPGGDVLPDGGVPSGGDAFPDMGFRCARNAM